MDEKALVSASKSLAKHSVVSSPRRRHLTTCRRPTIHAVHMEEMRRERRGAAMSGRDGARYALLDGLGSSWSGAEECVSRAQMFPSCDN